MSPVIYVDRRWGRPYAQDTGNESGMSGTGSEAAVTTEMNILEDLVMIDPHMSASYLSVTATAHLHTVSLAHLCTSKNLNV